MSPAIEENSHLLGHDQSTFGVQAVVWILDGFFSMWVRLHHEESFGKCTAPQGVQEDRNTFGILREISPNRHAEGRGLGPFPATGKYQHRQRLLLVTTWREAPTFE